MFVDTFERLIYSDNPAVIEWQVQDALKNGEDLSQNPFVFRGQFCQWVTARVSLYQYKLVSAHSPSEFDAEVRRMKSEGFELALKEVDWDGMICQWMAKSKDTGTVHASTALRFAAPTEAGYVPTVFNLVERVQKLTILGDLSFSSSNFLPGDIR